MKIIDPKKLMKLKAIQDCSNRCLAGAAGWKSHSYVNRILAGEITTVTPERAARIAEHFGVGIDDLFVARVSSDAGKCGHRGRAS